MSAITNPAHVVELSPAAADFAITAVCQCGQPITRDQLRIENFGTDADPCYNVVACCSDDSNAASPDEINLDEIWAWHVRLGLNVAKLNLEARIKNMWANYNEAAKRFRDDNDPNVRTGWTPEDVI